MSSAHGLSAEEAKLEAICHQVEAATHKVADKFLAGLPSEYQDVSTSLKSLVDDVDMYRKRLEREPVVSRVAFLVLLTSNILSKILNSSHDVAEDRAVKNETLCTTEKTFIKELSLAADDARSSCKEIETTGYSLGVISLDFEKSLSSSSSFSRSVVATPGRRFTKVEEKRAVRDFIIDSDGASSEKESAGRDRPQLFTVSVEEMDAFKRIYIHNPDEVLLHCGLVVVGLRKRVRYLFLTSRQLVVLENVDSFKESVELGAIKKITQTGDNSFSVATQSKTRPYTSRDATEWVKQMQSALAFFQALEVAEKETVSPLAPKRRPTAENTHALTVKVRGKGSYVFEGREKAGRTPFVYFTLGIGQPLEYGLHDRMHRVSSSVHELGYLGSSQEEFHLSFSPWHKCLVHVELHEGASNRDPVWKSTFAAGDADFHDVFLNENHSVVQTIAMTSHTGQEIGQVELDISVPGYDGFQPPEVDQKPLSALQMLPVIEVREKVPFVFSDWGDVVAAVQGMGSTKTFSEIRIMDASSKGLLQVVKRVKRNVFEIGAGGRGGGDIFGRLHIRTVGLFSPQIRVTLQLETQGREALLMGSGTTSAEVLLTDGWGGKAAAISFLEGNEAQGSIARISVANSAVDRSILVAVALVLLKR